MEFDKGFSPIVNCIHCLIVCGGGRAVKSAKEGLFGVMELSKEILSDFLCPVGSNLKPTNEADLSIKMQNLPSNGKQCSAKIDLLGSLTLLFLQILFLHHTTSAFSFCTCLFYSENVLQSEHLNVNSNKGTCFILAST